MLDIFIFSSHSEGLPSDFANLFNIFEDLRNSRKWIGKDILANHFSDILNEIPSLLSIKVIFDHAAYKIPGFIDCTLHFNSISSGDLHYLYWGLFIHVYRFTAANAVLLTSKHLKK